MKRKERYKRSEGAAPSRSPEPNTPRRSALPPARGARERFFMPDGTGETSLFVPVAQVLAAIEVVLFVSLLVLACVCVCSRDTPPKAGRNNWKFD